MADNLITEKVYCHDYPQNNDAAFLAAMNNNGWQNNPFMYLIFLALFGNNGWNNRGGDLVGENYNSRQIAALQDSVNSNHNNDIALQAINGNRDAISMLAQTFNTSFGQMQMAICGVKSAIEQVGGAVGYTAESVKNAIALGDANIIQQMQSCCCQNKELVQRMGYESQLATERQINILGSQMAAQHSADQLKDCEYHGQTMSRIDQLANGITQGFSATAYEASKNTQAIINAQNANTQRILDQMCANSQQALRDQLAEKDRQLLAANIIAGVKTNGCGCGC